MEGENNNMENTNNGAGMSYEREEKKSASLLWAVIAVAIIVLLGYLFVKTNSPDTLNQQDQVNQVEDFGNQSDSSELNSIEADLNSTDFDSLDVELE